ncbi:MAG: hypothetical protein ACJ8FY_07810 [Gemmataceae bacterium]
MAKSLSDSSSHQTGTNGDLAARLLRREAEARAVPNRRAAQPVLEPTDSQESETPQADYVASESQDELSVLRDENQQLRTLVTELEHHLEDLTGPNSPNGQLAEQNKEMEALLEEKSEVIRDLHLKVNDLQEELSKKPVVKAATPHEEELMRMHEEVERDRKQLQQDEDSMMQQMREMEIQMAKERAEIARQRNEMQRLHAEIRHELELAARDATLRERLAPLQRRHQDVMNRRGSSPAAAAGHAPPTAIPVAPAPQPTENRPAKKDSGLLRRLFR